ncbi:rootletin isoform X2 [Cydia strobilella]
MECGAAELSRKLRVDQSKENSDREDLKTDIQHRKETFYREAPPADSAVSSAPASLSPQPLTDMWSCGQCRAAQERAASAARECARLGEQLRDARDQLELMEFRLLELDALPDKARDNLTDSDSGCVSPGSRIKDSASPELKRMDSGYKSPAPSSPHPRRHLATPHDDFKEDFAKAQVLADILDRTSESSDSLRSNPVKEHLEQMILNAGSVEDRNCLEQVLMLLYNLQALSSSVSEDECYQIKPKRICDLKTKQETDITSQKIQKAIATVTPYQQKGYKCESLESLCSDERKPSNVLQESGIFEGVETETRSTQTDVNDSFECSGELNTEIQRLNSIREKLERQGVRNRTLNSKEEGDSLECRCVKLGKKHKQYYERRLKFLEGKISIYEAAQDVKEAKLAQRLQTEFILENRIQELELQLSELQDKYERLEEECCELEEIENDTRLHWQQLEMDYELCSAQLRDMTEQRECSRAQAERLMADLNRNECALKHKQEELRTRLCKLEKAVPALIAWNVINALGAYISPGKERMLASRCPFGKDTRAVINQVQKEKSGALVKYVTTPHDDLPGVADMQEMVFKLLKEKREIENQTTIVTNSLKAKVRELQEELDSTKIQIRAAECRCSSKGEQIQEKISELKDKIDGESLKEELPVDPATMNQIQALLAIEKELKARVAELERRETAYLEMLTQADDMWAEMEGGYKKKIEEAHATEHGLKGQVKKLQDEKDQFKKIIEPLKKTIRELEESDSLLKVALEKSERDSQKHQSLNLNLQNTLSKTQADFKKSETAFKSLEAKFKGEVEQLRRMNKNVEKEMKTTKEASRKTEQKFFSELESVRKELQRACKNHQDLEVTNGELKEEVESLEKQLALTQKALTQCKRKCDEKIKTLSHELSIKTEELEELRSETMRQSFHASRIELKPDRSEYVDEGYSIYTAIPKKTDYDRMHHSMSYITSSSRCSCPAMRSQLVGQLIEDLFDRIHNTVDDDLTRVCKEIKVTGKEMSAETKAKITNYLLMAISKELVRSIGDADAKTDTEEWQRAASTLSLPYRDRDRDRALDRSALGARLEGNAGVVRGAARLASVSCACAAARLAAALPDIADGVKVCQEEVLDHGDVKIMEEQLANAIESIVNCPSCALGTNAIVWSTDV